MRNTNEVELTAKERSDNLRLCATIFGEDSNEYREMSEGLANMLATLESDVIQTAIYAHCRPDDEERREAHHDAVSALIDARYQSLRAN